MYWLLLSLLLLWLALHVDEWEDYWDAHAGKIIHVSLTLILILTLWYTMEWWLWLSEP